MKQIIGVDVGGTLLRAARFDSDLNLLERAEQETSSELGQDVVLERLYNTIQQVMPEDPDEVAGIGVGVPGPVDPETGVVISPPNLPLKGEVPIRDLIHKAVGGKVIVGNDADAAGLAEHQMGAGRGTRNMIYLTVSTGVGGGIIVDGKPTNGQGLGAEIGHMVVEPGGPICGCGRRGHLEAVAYGTGIANLARERLKAGEASSLSKLSGSDLERIDAKLVGEAAQQGDALALSIITSAGRYVGITIASLIMLLNPEMFVLGGGVTNLGDLLFKPMHEAIREYVMTDRHWQITRIEMAQLGVDVGLVGAAALARLNVMK